MPFFVALAISLHIGVLGPLFLLFSQGEQFGANPYLFLGWPLLGAVIAAAIIGFVLKLTTKHDMQRPLAFAAAFGVYTYLQFYVLVWNFGPFDGRAINFADYIVPGLIEGTAILAIFVPAFIWPSATSKLYSRLVSVVFIFSMVFGIWQFVSRDIDNANLEVQKRAQPISRVASSSYLRDANIIPGILEWSKEKNVVVLLLDTLQVDVFQNIIEGDPALRKQFEGFTLFTNATGHFPYTALAIPSIVTGEPYNPKKETIPDYQQRVAEKRYEAVLEKHGFQPSRLPLHNRADFLSANTATCRKYGTAYDLYSFRQIPVVLKTYFYDEGRFQIARLCGADQTTESEVDLAVFDYLTKNSTATAQMPTVKYIHFWGAHPPAMIDADCNVRKQGVSFSDFQGQAKCILHKTGAYLDKLRSLGVFEDAMMFIISDHGARYGFLQKDNGKSKIPGYVMSSANPTIAFHDFGNTNEFRISDAPVMLADIYATIMRRNGIASKNFGTSLTEIDGEAVRPRPYVFFRNAGDAANKFLSKTDSFVIRGNVKDPESWTSTGDSNDNLEENKELKDIDFSNPSISNFLGLGWSSEAKGVAQSWIISSPAYITGVLPDEDLVRITIDYLNPHTDQSIMVKVNGREIAHWAVPQPESWTKETFEFRPTPAEKGKSVQLEIDVGKVAFVKKDSARESGISVRSIKVEAVSAQ